MLKNHRVQSVLGIIIATVIAGFLDWMSWSAVAFSIPVGVVFAFAIPSKYIGRNVYTLSVGFWIAVGMIFVPLVARLFNLGQYLGWIALVWLIFSVVAGMLWPLPNAKKIANENSNDPSN